VCVEADEAEADGEEAQDDATVSIDAVRAVLSDAGTINYISHNAFLLTFAIIQQRSNISDALSTVLSEADNAPALLFDAAFESLQFGKAEFSKHQQVCLIVSLTSPQY
jgi:hypothetical protein